MCSMAISNPPGIMADSCYMRSFATADWSLSQSDAVCWKTVFGKLFLENRFWQTVFGETAFGRKTCLKNRCWENRFWETVHCGKTLFWQKTCLPTIGQPVAHLSPAIGQPLANHGQPLAQGWHAQIFFPKSALVISDNISDFIAAIVLVPLTWLNQKCSNMHHFLDFFHAVGYHCWLGCRMVEGCCHGEHHVARSRSKQKWHCQVWKAALLQASTTTLWSRR